MVSTSVLGNKSEKGSSHLQTAHVLSSKDILVVERSIIDAQTTPASPALKPAERTAKPLS
eukprot:CAMPEP_0170463208 /NCGR_PEP_ID=MMETSP0123-20130129/8412_1 /TAXON_ID=182087 /ORGANISM="Favella ehrenbergii, Strain Fehren 1" /LENGTH=59 /DNA_ID=CAMNT_0010728595 /DNA_START=431 /DNA_END=610 /DNA_ORIENTATION=+